MTAAEREQFLSHEITVEEKVDGANLGVWMTDSFELRFQNRGKMINAQSATQWHALDEWARTHSADLYELLAPREDGTRRILFGEWLLAKHSIEYDALPAYFVAFDIYDSAIDSFLSVAARNELLESTMLPVVHCVASSSAHTLEQLLDIIENTTSAYVSEAVPLEGVYLKFDEGDVNRERCKLVRKEFIQAIDKHWSKNELVKNRIRY